MARRSGRNSQVYIDISSAGTGSATPVNFLMSWKVGQAVDNIDVTSFGDGSKTYVPGLPDASGSCDGFIDMGTEVFSNLTDGVARKMYIYPDRSNNETIYGFCTAYFGADYEGSVSDALKVSLSWSAASTFTWSATGV